MEDERQQRGVMMVILTTPMDVPAFVQFKPAGIAVLFLMPPASAMKFVVMVVSNGRTILLTKK